MRWTSLVRALVFLMSVGVLATPHVRDTTGTGASTRASAASLAGQVLAGETEPIRGARVTLNDTAGSGGRTAATDDRGRFQFTGIPAGRYLLEAFKPGYLPARFGAKRLGGLGTPLALHDDQALTDLVLRMTRGAAISGTVFDEHGHPEPSVQISVLRDGIDPITGLRRLVPANAERLVTGPNGDYRAFGLLPGEYFVVADVRSHTLVFPSVPDIRRLAVRDPGAAAAATEGVAFAPVFYPGTPDAASALSVTVAAGEELTDVSFPIAVFTTATVSGAVAGASEAPLESVTLELLPHNRLHTAQLGLGLAIFNSAHAGTAGAFEFRGVVPGAYRILARAGAKALPRNAVARSGFLAAFWGESIVDVNGTDTAANVELRPGATVHGRVTARGASALPDPRQMTLKLRDLERGELTLRPAADGGFVIEGLAPGRYRLSLDPSDGQSRWAVRSIVLGGRDVTDALFNLDVGADMEVVATLTDRPAGISGTLLHADQVVATDYFIVVFPAGDIASAIGSSRIAQARPDSSGKYVFPALLPGDYCLAVTADLLPSDLLDAHFLQQLMPLAVRLVLIDSEQKRCDLRIGGS